MSDPTVSPVAAAYLDIMPNLDAWQRQIVEKAPWRRMILVDPWRARKTMYMGQFEQAVLKAHRELVLLTFRSEKTTRAMRDLTRALTKETPQNTAMHTAYDRRRRARARRRRNR